MKNIIINYKHIPNKFLSESRTFDSCFYCNISITSTDTP